MSVIIMIINCQKNCRIFHCRIFHLSNFPVILLVPFVEFSIVEFSVVEFSNHPFGSICRIFHLSNFPLSNFPLSNFQGTEIFRCVTIDLSVFQGYILIENDPHIDWVDKGWVTSFLMSRKESLMTTSCFAQKNILWSNGLRIES